MYYAMLIVLYRLGFRKTAVSISNRWGVFSHGWRYSAAADFQSVQRLYPVCPDCRWMIMPNEPHDWCEKQARLAKDEEADWVRFVAEQEAEMARQAEEDNATWERFRADCQNPYNPSELSLDLDESLESIDFDDDLDDDFYDERDDEDEDDYVSSGEVYGRAYRHFGNSERAREAAELTPGDFI